VFQVQEEESGQPSEFELDWEGVTDTRREREREREGAEEVPHVDPGL
jgi:hypothetical protein